MNKSLFPILSSFCLCLPLISCANNGISESSACSNTSCSFEASQTSAPIATGDDDPLKTGAYVFKVSDSSGNPVSNVTFNIDVVRNISHGDWLQIDGDTLDVTSDEDGDVFFTLKQLENIESNGDYGLWSMSDVEDRTPEESKEIKESGYGEKEVTGLHCTDDKGGEYNGFYETNSVGEYRTYFLGYSYQGEEYGQHAIHQVDLQWNWERTLNGIFSHKFTVTEWDEEENRSVERSVDGGHILITLTECPEGYSLKRDVRKISYSCVASGTIYEKYAQSANYVFVSDTIVLDKTN